MMSIIQQTRDEKMAIYMKLTRRELAEMLINCNEALQARPSYGGWMDGGVAIQPGQTAWFRG